ncbi:MAG: gamma-glutamyl-phosphate reductase, partial [Bacteroidota bacterium]
MLEDDIVRKAQLVRQAGRILYNCSTAKKNDLLKAINARLRSETSAIIDANKIDLKNAEQSGLSKVLMDRL